MSDDHTIGFMKRNEPIKRRKLSHEIMDRLLEMINSGELKEGDQLPSEHDLMDRYGVGRPSVREAMQSLEGMGLISIQHGEKAKVKKVTAEDIFDQISATTQHLLSSSVKNVEHLREARQIFEVGVVRLAVQRASSSCIKKLEKKLDHMRESKGDHEEFVKADQSFHTAIAEISGNPIFGAVSQAMFKWLSGFHYTEYPNLLGVPELEELTLKEHEAIFQCIRDRDSSGAARAMSDHILRVNKLYNGTNNRKTN
jgi:DNA-binding FadR family transcriptional regulator